MKKKIGETIAKAIMIGVGILLLAVVLAVLCAIPVWLLWNWLCPTLFGWVEITLMQALGLSILTSLLFKSSSSK